MGNYPRELHLDTDTETSLISYLHDELVRHYYERQPAVDELIELQHDYWAEPATKIRTFPFTKASNIVVPLTAIATESIHARFMTNMFAVKPFITAKARAALTADSEKPLENWFDYELKHSIGIRKPISDFFLETEKFGTGIIKSGYEKIVKKAVREDAAGNSQEFAVPIRDGATLDMCPQANFLFPFSYKDPQLAPWVGEEHSRNPYEVKLMEESGFIRKGAYEHLLPYVQQSTIGTAPSLARKYEREQEKIEQRESHWPRRIDWAEIWLAFDVDGDGTEEEIVVHYHPMAKYIMSIRYNWYEDLHRPYRIAVYFPVEGRWRGIGIGKMSKQFQREITTMHRQRLDNATIANMRMFKIHKLSGYGPKEPIFPGKMWFLDDMTHIESFQIGEIYQSAFTNEQASLIYEQQRTSVNEVTLGMPQVGTPGTATSDLARIQEGNKKFDYCYDNGKETVNIVLVDLLCNIAQFGPKNDSYFQFVEHGNLVQQALALPIPLLRQSILFEIAAVGQSNNRIVDRQDWTQISQMLIQYYTSLFQLTEGTPYQETVRQKAIIASTEAMKQILESYDKRNIDRLIVGNLEAMLLNAASAPKSAPALGRGNNGNSGNGNSQPGVDILTALTQALGRGSSQAAPVVQNA